MNEPKKDIPVTEVLQAQGEAIHELTKFIQKQEQLNDLIIKKQKQDFDFVKYLAKLTLITPFFPLIGIIAGIIFYVFFSYIFGLYSQSKPDGKLGFIIGALGIIVTILIFYAGRWSKKVKK